MMRDVMLLVLLITITVWVMVLYNSKVLVCSKETFIQDSSATLVDWSKPFKASDLDVYLINLDRNKDRLESFVNQYVNCDLRNKQFQRFNAVDGQKIANIEDKITEKAYEEIMEVEKSGYRTKHYQLTRGAIGCYMSHMAVYDLISKSDAPYGLIFEDDVVIDKYILKKLNSVIVNIPNDWDILLLSCHCIVCDKMDMYYDTGKFFWLHCYIVRKSSVDKIRKYLSSTKIGKQIDSELSDMISKGKLKVYCLKDSLCKQGNTFQTTIQTPLKVVPGINPWAMV